MSRSYARSYANQSGAGQRRRVQEDIPGRPGQGQGRPGQGMSQGHSEEQHDDSTPPQEPNPQEPNPPENEKYQRRDAYTVIAPNEEKRQNLLRIQKQEEETARRRKEEKARTPVKITPKPVGGERGLESEFIEHQQKMANKSQTVKALEMKEKREKWKRGNKEREEKDIEKKKAAARLQAEKNEKKQSLQREESRRHWAERYNDQSTRPPQEYSSRPHEDYSYSYSASGGRSFPSQDEDMLVQLCRRFPNCDPTMLSELLREQGSVDRVCNILE